MRKSKTRFVHVRIDCDLEHAVRLLCEERGQLSALVNEAIRKWYRNSKQQVRLMTQK